MINQKLKEELLKQLGISQQALSQQCKKLKKQVPMTTEDAVYVIAQRKGIILDSYLDKDTIERIRVLYQQVTHSTTQPEKTRREKVKSRVVRQTIVNIGKDIEMNAPILPRNKLIEAQEMANVYPLIYVLENSIRELIDKLMTKHYGADWWNSQAPSSLRNEVEHRMVDDKKDSWHQRRGSRPIDYTDLKDLPRLMSKLESVVVPDIIPDLDWFRQLVKEVYKSRCVVCHMNPLDKINIDSVSLKFKQWQKQIDAKKELILKSTS
jgi:hypothetical protein